MTDLTAIRRRGLMLVLSSPSGAGKSSIARNLLAREAEGGQKRLTLSVSVTTRERRHSEVEDVDYHFIDKERFEEMRERDELLEWAEVHSNLYATPRKPVEAALSTGVDVLFDIDWQGTRQLAAKMPEDIVRIFVLPPSMSELRARLERRAEDGAEVIARRLANSRTEIEHWTDYDYVIVNEDLSRSVAAVQAILNGERLRRIRQVGMTDHVSRLLSEDL